MLATVEEKLEQWETLCENDPSYLQRCMSNYYEFHRRVLSENGSGRTTPAQTRGTASPQMSPLNPSAPQQRANGASPPNRQRAWGASQPSSIRTAPNNARGSPSPSTSNNRDFLNFAQLSLESASSEQRPMTSAQKPDSSTAPAASTIPSNQQVGNASLGRAAVPSNIPQVGGSSTASPGSRSRLSRGRGSRRSSHSRIRSRRARSEWSTWSHCTARHLRSACISTRQRPCGGARERMEGVGEPAPSRAEIAERVEGSRSGAGKKRCTNRR
ncbi:hypothetical protein C8Q76DRAFT_206314 [Earliella scabrosa]|nr:hypothetical protein C8Q76DRAFT_206314 [Earliella scabrosa]